MNTAAWGHLISVKTVLIDDLPCRIRVPVTGPHPIHSNTPIPCAEERWSWALVTHACKPSYSGGRNQEDGSSKPVQANSLRDAISKIAISKRAGGVAQGEGPEFKPQYRKKEIK
jgi:hypothetical protein